MKIASFTLLVVLIVASAVGAQTTSREAQPAASPALQRSGGSLLRATLGQPGPQQGQAKLDQVSFFAVPEPQPKTLKKHDYVTIIVREQSEAKTDAKTELKRESTIDLQLQNWIRANMDSKSLQAVTVPPINGEFSREFKGDGKENRSDSFTARITAEVIDVKPNGTVVLQARKEIKIDDEEQLYLLSGGCRAEDVTPDNTILSTQMADFNFQKINKGAVRDATKRGFLTKLLDAVNPF